MRTLPLLVVLAALLGCAHAEAPSRATSPEEIAGTVGSLLNDWDPNTFRAIDWQPEIPGRAEFYGNCVFIPAKAVASGGLTLQVTKIEVNPHDSTEARVYFDLLFKGSLKRRPQQVDPSRTNLYDRGDLLLIQTNGAWKLKQIFF